MSAPSSIAASAMSLLAHRSSTVILDEKYTARLNVEPSSLTAMELPARESTRFLVLANLVGYSALAPPSVAADHVVPLVLVARFADPSLATQRPSPTE